MIFVQIQGRYVQIGVARMVFVQGLYVIVILVFMVMIVVKHNVHLDNTMINQHLLVYLLVLQVHIKINTHLLVYLVILHVTSVEISLQYVLVVCLHLIILNISTMQHQPV